MQTKRSQKIVWLVIGLLSMLMLSCLFLVLAGPNFLPKSVEISFKGYTGVTAIEITGKNVRETKTITDKNQLDRIFNKLNSYSGTWTRQGDVDFPFTLRSFNYSLTFIRGNTPQFERLGIGDNSLIFDYTTYKEIGKEEVKSLLEVLGI